MFFLLFFFLWLPTRMAARESCGSLKSIGRVSHGLNFAPSVPGQWEWLVAIRRKDRSGRNAWICGGSLIHPRFVITAAHCIRKNKRDFLPIEVFIGAHNLGEEMEEGRRLEAEVMETHPEYVLDSHQHDLGIIRLNAPIFDHEPLCLPPGNASQPTVNQICWTVGWGADESNTAPLIPKFGKIPVVSIEECKSAWGNDIDNSTEFCAGHINPTARRLSKVPCHGDSGGPLMCLRSGKFFLSGIISAGSLVCGYKPAVFVSVVRFKRWIDFVIGQYKEDTPPPSWSGWGSWSSCSVSCGSGTSSRRRHCLDHQKKLLSVDNCAGLAQEKSSCNAGVCISWSRWEQWGSCSASCGSGTTTRQRQCLLDHQDKVSAKYCRGSAEESSSCSDGDCISWSIWGEWGRCSVSCGLGSTSRLRQCVDQQDQVPLTKCPGSAEETRSCNAGICRSWTHWSPWGLCSRTCGSNGFKRRRRFCNGGSGCPGKSGQWSSCGSKEPCEGSWGPWSKWQPCSESCGNGTKARVRECRHGVCRTGFNATAAFCNLPPCPDWGEWNDWTACSTSCGRGTRTRSRRCHHGVCKTGSSRENIICNLSRCPFWSLWSLWSRCLGTCGKPGHRVRTRECEYGSSDKDCRGTAITGVRCRMPQCPRRGRGIWSQWAVFTGCSATCGTGMHFRQRSCLQGPCDGAHRDAQSCDVGSCPGSSPRLSQRSGVVAKISRWARWTRWSPWSHCSATCGAAKRYRSCPGGGCRGRRRDTKRCRSRFRCPFY